MTEAMPDWVRQYLNRERVLDDRMIEFFGIEYVEEEPDKDGKMRPTKALTFPVPVMPISEQVIRYRSLTSYNPQTRKSTHNTARKMWWADRPAGAPETPPYPSWNDWRDPATEVICAGELDAMCAIAHGILATTGTLGEGTFSQSWALALAGQTRILLYDHDQSGHVGMVGGWVKPKDGAKPYWKDGAGEILAAAGCNVLIAHWPSTVEVGWDVTEHFKAGGTAEQLRTILAGAEPWKRPPDRPTDRKWDDAKLAALAARRSPSQVVADDDDPFEIPGTALMAAPKGRRFVVAE